MELKSSLYIRSFNNFSFVIVICNFLAVDYILCIVYESTCELGILR